MDKKTLAFYITEEEYEKIQKFKESYSKEEKYAGTIGGAFSYVFTPTSIGIIGKIIGPDNKEFCFKELD